MAKYVNKLVNRNNSKAEELLLAPDAENVQVQNQAFKNLQNEMNFFEAFAAHIGPDVVKMVNHETPDKDGNVALALEQQYGEKVIAAGSWALNDEQSSGSYISKYRTLLTNYSNLFYGYVLPSEEADLTSEFSDATGKIKATVSKIEFLNDEETPAIVAEYTKGTDNNYHFQYKTLTSQTVSENSEWPLAWYAYDTSDKTWKLFYNKIPTNNATGQVEQQYYQLTADTNIKITVKAVAASQNGSTNTFSADSNKIFKLKDILEVNTPFTCRSVLNKKDTATQKDTYNIEIVNPVPCSWKNVIYDGSPAIQTLSDDKSTNNYPSYCKQTGTPEQVFYLYLHDSDVAFQRLKFTSSGLITSSAFTDTYNYLYDTVSALKEHSEKLLCVEAWTNLINLYGAYQAENEYYTCVISDSRISYRSCPIIDINVNYSGSLSDINLSTIVPSEGVGLLQREPSLIERIFTQWKKVVTGICEDGKITFMSYGQPDIDIPIKYLIAQNSSNLNHHADTNLQGEPFLIQRNFEGVPKAVEYDMINNNNAFGNYLFRYPTDPTTDEEKYCYYWGSYSGTGDNISYTYYDDSPTGSLQTGSGTLPVESIEEEDLSNWCLKINRSGQLFLFGEGQIDVYAVGGGGAGGMDRGGGGGGGYTKLVTNIPMSCQSFSSNATLNEDAETLVEESIEPTPDDATDTPSPEESSWAEATESAQNSAIVESLSGEARNNWINITIGDGGKRQERVNKFKRNQDGQPTKVTFSSINYDNSFIGESTLLLESIDDSATIDNIKTQIETLLKQTPSDANKYEDIEAEGGHCGGSWYTLKVKGVRTIRGRQGGNGGSGGGHGGSDDKHYKASKGGVNGNDGSTTPGGYRVGIGQHESTYYFREEAYGVRTSAGGPGGGSYSGARLQGQDGAGKGGAGGSDITEANSSAYGQDAKANTGSGGGGGCGGRGYWHQKKYKAGYGGAGGSGVVLIRNSRKGVIENA